MENLSFRTIITNRDRIFSCKVYKSTRIQEFEGIDWASDQVDSFLESQFNTQHKYYIESWPNARYEIVTLGGVDVGRVYRDYREDEIRIIDIAILPQYRGRGIGEHIIKSILNEAQSLRKVVRIHVEKFNPAMNLYTRLSFIKIGGTEVYDLMEWSNSSVLSN